jgi:hypothetical protein
MSISHFLSPLVTTALIATALTLRLGHPSFGALSNPQRAEAYRIRQSVFRPSGRINEEILNNLTKEQREELESALWEDIGLLQQQGVSGYALNNSMETRRLAMLGNDSAREMVVQAYFEDPAFSIAYLNDPKLIPLIGDQLFKSEPLWSSASGVGLFGAQEYARRDILKLLQNTKFFNEEVTRWAGLMLPNSSGLRDFQVDPPGTEILRRWYRANEVALKAWDFKAVKPGDEVQRPATGNANVTLPLANAADNHLDGTPRSHSVQSPVNEDRVRSREHRSPATAWIIGIIALCCLLILILRKRR